MRYQLRTSAVAAAFFLSGGCGLIYESLWTRYVSELTGGTALSQLIVLMVFMGGLALGAMLAGRLVDRRREQGLLVYGVLEICIGLYAIFFPLLHSLSANLYSSIGTNLESGSSGLLILKILLSFSLIIMPAVAMGGTLPAVTRYLTRSCEVMRGNISLLYGINSLGAVVGILSAGFFLVYRYGMDASMQYTGAFNLLLGLSVLAFACFSGSADEFRTEQPPGVECSAQGIPDCHIYQPYEIRTAIIAAGIAGFAAMALQVAWIRYFVIFLGATHSSFTIVVAAFIFGIGLGSLLVKTNMAGRLYLPGLLLSLLLLMAVTLWLELFLYARLPFEVGRILGIFARIPFAWPFYSVTKFGILFCLMLGVTIASGMVLPVCVRICERDTEHVGRDVARVYAVNTIAALLGILVTSQLLFRVFDLPRTLQVIMLIYLTTAIFLTLVLVNGTVRRLILACLAVLLVGHPVIWQPWSPVQLFVYRVNFSYEQPIYYKEFLQFIRQKVVINDLHGPDAHVTVVDNTDGPQKYQSLFINGKPDAGTSTDMAVQVLLGHLPTLLHPHPQNVFVLGAGSGITSGEILKFQDIREVVTAELAAEVFEASKSFADYNGRFWENPRHRMVIDDGMTFLRHAKEQFDIIVLEPSNVWQAGMPGLFSEDFFRIVNSKLKPGGVVAQWLHLYMLDDMSVDIVLKTFSRVFPNASIFIPDHENILLIGYDEQWQFDPQSLVRRFNQPEILESQKKIGNTNGAALLLREAMDRRSFSEFTKVLSMPINTLNFPILEQTAEYGFFLGKSSTLLQKIDSRLNPDDGNMLFHEYAKQIGFDFNQHQAVIESTPAEGSNPLRESLNFMFLNRSWPEDQPSPPVSALSYMYDSQLREIIMHPYYRKPAEQLTANEAYNLFGAELLVWHKAASQLWTPDPERLHQLYNRFAMEADQETAGSVARKAAFSLAMGRACSAALPFFKIAENKGALTPETMTPDEIGAVFNCEAHKGEIETANRWWKVVLEKNMPQTTTMKADKATLDIKLGGAPPPPIYGRLPNRWN